MFSGFHYTVFEQMHVVHFDLEGGPEGIIEWNEDYILNLDLKNKDIKVGKRLL
jgi:hypothetical protein